MDTQKKLYIHIGKHKTGTSALQQFFSINRGSLKKKGIVYPEIKDGRAKHQRLVWGFIKNVKVPVAEVTRKFGGYKKEWKLALCQNSDTLISTEAFSKCSKENMLEIKKMASKFDVKIVIYIRRQDRMANSVMNQITKDSNRIWTEYDKLSRNLDYLKKIESWAGVFGKENIIVRLYEKQQFYKGSLIADFLHHVHGIELTNEFEIPRTNFNSRLHQVVLEYKRLINHLSMMPLERLQLKAPLIEISNEFFENGTHDDSVFSPQQRIEIIEQYSQINQQIARKYLDREDGRLFYDPLPDIDEEWKPYRQLLKEDAEFINNYLKNNYPKVFRRVIRRFKWATKSGDPKLKQVCEKLSPGMKLTLPERAQFVVFGLRSVDKYPFILKAKGFMRKTLK